MKEFNLKHDKEMSVIIAKNQRVISRTNIVNFDDWGYPSGLFEIEEEGTDGEDVLYRRFYKFLMTFPDDYDSKVDTIVEHTDVAKI